MLHTKQSSVKTFELNLERDALEINELLILLGTLLIFSLPKKKALDWDNKGHKHPTKVICASKVPKSKCRSFKSCCVNLHMITFSSAALYLMSNTASAMP